VQKRQAFAGFVPRRRPAPSRHPWRPLPVGPRSTAFTTGLTASMRAPTRFKQRPPRVAVAGTHRIRRLGHRQVGEAASCGGLLRFRPQPRASEAGPVHPRTPACRAVSRTRAMVSAEFRLPARFAGFRSGAVTPCQVTIMASVCARNVLICASSIGKDRSNGHRHHGSGPLTGGHENRSRADDRESDLTGLLVVAGKQPRRWSGR